MEPGAEAVQGTRDPRFSAEKEGTMKTTFWKLTTIFTAVLCLTVFGATLSPAMAGPGGIAGPPDDKPGGGHTESYGNNLSFPVIWSEGVDKVLRGDPDMDPVIEGEWWYWWGTEGEDPNIVPLSCPPDPDDMLYCDDGAEGTTGPKPGDEVADVYKAYLQKDPANEWQAETLYQNLAIPLNVNWIDWGDNLESVDWYTKSQVRTEVVLYQDLVAPMLAYDMLHTSGWGIDEVHGLAELDGIVQNYWSSQATVYSHCARLTIQKLLVDRNDPLLAGLVWDAGVGEWTNPEGASLVNPTIFNMAVHEAADGPGYYNAEINVKGRIIYGYTWNVRRLNDNSGGTAAGDYRITFSFDEVCGGTTALNTFFVDDTEIIVRKVTTVSRREAVPWVCSIPRTT
jgi:hypothetical protein